MPPVSRVPCATPPPAPSCRTPRGRLPQRPVPLQLRLPRRGTDRADRLRPRRARQPHPRHCLAGWLWTISADDGPPTPEQARRLRLIAAAYGLANTSGLLDAVVAGQEDNLADALTRTRSNNSAIAEYANASVAWQRQQSAWLRQHASTVRAALEAAGPP
jgi:hypothetical protein